MEVIQTLFSQGQLLFAKGDFANAYSAFEQCIQLIPSLSAGWENMAVCLVNQGVGLNDIEERLLSQAPTVVHSTLKQKIASLQIPLATSTTRFDHLKLIQEFKLAEAVESFSQIWNKGRTSDDDAIQFLRGLFIAHEHLAKKQGLLYLPQLLNDWKDRTAIQHCMSVTSDRTQALILRHKSAGTTATPEEIELLETLGLVHYTYTNYDNAAFIFKTLCALSTDLQKLDEYRTHLSTCYSLNGQYKEALEMDEDNSTAWERFDPCNPKAFRAQTLKMIRSAERIGRICLPYWPAGLIDWQDENVTIAKLRNAFVCGHDPMIFDDDFVYAGNRGSFRFAPVNQGTPTQKETGIVVVSTNPNNYYHLLIEFSAKLLSAHPHCPPEIPVYIPTNNLQLVRQMARLLQINRPIETFSVHDNLAFTELYVIDVRTPGHFTQHPANLWDCYLSQAESIRSMIRRFLEATPQDSADSTRTLIYAKRAGGARSFADPNNDVETLLKRWANQQGLQFTIFEGKMDLQSQINLFRGCRVLFGIHGAGFTNLLFTPTDCAMVEIPIHGNCNPLFQELSALLKREHIVCTATCEYQGSLDVTARVLSQIENALNKSI